MKRLLIAAGLVAAVALGLTLGSGPKPHQTTHLGVSFRHQHRFVSLCASQDCGPYQATFTWNVPTIVNQTGYSIYLNGAQVASAAASPYVFSGMDCGTTYTLGVQAVSPTTVGPLWTLKHIAPACTSSQTPLCSPSPCNGNSAYGTNRTITVANGVPNGTTQYTWTEAIPTNLVITGTSAVGHQVPVVFLFSSGSFVAPEAKAWAAEDGTVTTGTCTSDANSAKACLGPYVVVQVAGPYAGSQFSSPAEVNNPTPGGVGTQCTGSDSGVITAGSPNLAGIGSPALTPAGYQFSQQIAFTGTTNATTTISTVSSFTDVQVGQAVWDSQGDIPAGDTISAVNSGLGTITLAVAATGSHGGDTITSSDFPQGTILSATGNGSTAAAASANALVSDTALYLSASCDSEPMIQGILQKIECSSAAPCVNADPTKIYFTGGSKGGGMALDAMCDERAAPLAAAFGVESNSLIAPPPAIGTATVANTTPNCPALGQQCLYAPSCQGSTNTATRGLFIYGSEDTYTNGNACGAGQTCISPTTAACNQLGEVSGSASGISILAAQTAAEQNCAGEGFLQGANSWFDGVEQLTGCTLGESGGSILTGPGAGSPCATTTASSPSTATIGGASSLLGSFLGCPQAPSTLTAFGSNGTNNSAVGTTNAVSQLFYRDHAPCSNSAELASIQVGDPSSGYPLSGGNVTQPIVGGDHLPQGVGLIDIPTEFWKFFTSQSMP